MIARTLLWHLCRHAHLNMRTYLLAHDHTRWRTPTLARQRGTCLPTFSSQLAECKLQELENADLSVPELAPDALLPPASTRAHTSIFIDIFLERFCVRARACAWM